MTLHGREQCSGPSQPQPSWEGAKIKRLLHDLPTVQLLRLADGERTGGLLSRGPRCRGDRAPRCLGLDKVHPDWWAAFCTQRQLILEALTQRELELFWWRVPASHTGRWQRPCLHPELPSLFPAPGVRLNRRLTRSLWRVLLGCLVRTQPAPAQSNATGDILAGSRRSGPFFFFFCMHARVGVLWCVL